MTTGTMSTSSTATETETKAMAKHQFRTLCMHGRIGFIIIRYSHEIYGVHIFALKTYAKRQKYTHKRKRKEMKMLCIYQTRQFTDFHNSKRPTLTVSTAFQMMPSHRASGRCMRVCVLVCACAFADGGRLPSNICGAVQQASVYGITRRKIYIFDGCGRQDVLRQRKRLSCEGRGKS